MLDKVFTKVTNIKKIFVRVLLPQFCITNSTYRQTDNCHYLWQINLCATGSSNEKCKKKTLDNNSDCLTNSRQRSKVIISFNTTLEDWHGPQKGH